MSKEPKLKQRQKEALLSKQQNLTEPTAKYWDEIVLDERWDELQRFLLSELDSRTSVQSDEVHLYADAQGFRRGWQECVAFIFNGSPEPVDHSPPIDESPNPYKTFGNTSRGLKAANEQS